MCVYICTTVGNRTKGPCPTVRSSRRGVCGTRQRVAFNGRETPKEQHVRPENNNYRDNNYEKPAKRRNGFRAERKKNKGETEKTQGIRVTNTFWRKFDGEYERISRWTECVLRARARSSRPITITITNVNLVELLTLAWTIGLWTVRVIH